MITVSFWGNIYTVTCGTDRREFDTKEDAFKCIEMLCAMRKAIN